jgi:hypothetical protein
VTAGTVLVLLATWVALEAWRGWPGPIRLLRRLASGRPPARRSHAPGLAGRSGVTHELTPARPTVMARLERPVIGACPGCGALDDEWCREGCDYLDRTDYR